MSIVSILLPIFFVFGVGFIFQKKFQVHTSTFSKLALYILVPFLIFRTFYQESINLSYLYIIVYMLGLCIAVIVIISTYSKFNNYNEKERCSLILSCAFMNNGNYGTPLILFLFGTSGMEMAIVLMVLQQLLMSTLGIYYAAKGSEKNNGVKAALKSVKRMPMVYAAIIGIVFNRLDIPIGTIGDGVNLIADAAIPFIMLTLGMQLANIKIYALEYKKISVALVIKLAIAPILAVAIVWWMPVTPLIKQIMIIMAATPTAANTTMYAIQYDTEPQTVTSATLATTLGSLITMPIVIYLVTNPM
ncbi:AEC family transporter [Salimicrobium sp. PL1-032A]|uniref:AEC family transporter n=1 Tax=Salimicrobium sp. PL1-032A TaxID=3095364 RepID=UPI003261B617